ncbi:MAG: hypothetical protein KDK36_02815 [Leptospiraceae bacterium]|nr:hypothetical protein [Leptospiraceae bacterium]
MGNDSEKIQILNQLVSIVDSQSSKFKSSYKKMPPAQFASERKLVLDNLNNAILVAGELKSVPGIKDTVNDLQRLKSELSALKQK